jgi:hypothetical protein
VDVPTFEQPQYLAACSLADLYLDLRIAFGITVQESRQHTLDVLRRAGDLQDAGISVTEQLSLLAYGARAIEKDTAARDQLLAFTGQEKPAPDPIEESQAKLVLEIDDLSRQGGLGNPQVQGRLRDSAEFGDGDKGTGLPKMHARLYHSGIRKQNAYVLDARMAAAESGARHTSRRQT